MTHANCTYCSNQKEEQAGLMPAIERYQSQRIAHIATQTQANQQNFYILSGEYGLIKSKDEIPWYDHLLVTNEVENMTSRVQAQLQTEGITSLEYFTADPAQQPAVQAYLDVITTACSRQKISLAVTMLDEPYVD